MVKNLNILTDRQKTNKWLASATVLGLIIGSDIWMINGTTIWR